VIERQVLPRRQPADPGVRKPALKLLIVKSKVSPPSEVEKSMIEGGVLVPTTNGMGPEAKMIGLPVVKYVAKVPPMDGCTEEVPGANVMVLGLPVSVKESLPKAPKKPLMESACAIAVELTAKAAKRATRLSIRLSKGLGMRGKKLLGWFLMDAP
jgi:hypothetical protein